MIREILIFGAIFFLMALLFHTDLINDPLSRFTHMNQRGNYLHPVIYSSIAYILIALFRGLVQFFKHLFRPKGK